MKNIQPTYATFEQAKLLKEKKWQQRTKIVWLDSLGKQHLIETNLSLELNNDEYNAPEQWQIVEWLRVNHNIDLQNICNYGRLGRTYRMGIIFINEKKEVDTIFLRPIDTPFKFIEFNSPQEAYSAAFDYILKELI
jgi:hypothetical protein